MDTSVVNTLLAAQEQAYRSAMEIFMKEIKEETKQLRSELQDVKISLEFTQKEVHDMKLRLTKVEQERKDDKVTINELQSSVKVIEDRCNYMDDYSRRNNLQFFGIHEEPNETWEQSAVKVGQLLQEKLQLPGIQPERAHRVGKILLNRQRPIIARFTRFCDREAVMRNASKLKGTRIFINEDLCPASQEIKRAQLPDFKQARSEGKVAYFRHTKLIIKERRTDAATTGLHRSGSTQASSVVVPTGAPAVGGVAATPAPAAAAAAAADGVVGAEAPKYSSVASGDSPGGVSVRDGTDETEAGVSTRSTRSSKVASPSSAVADDDGESGGAHGGVLLTEDGSSVDDVQQDSQSGTPRRTTQHQGTTGTTGKPSKRHRKK